MNQTIFVDYPADYSFFHTARSHGWYDLPPFRFDADRGRLSHTFAAAAGAVTVEIGDTGDGLEVETVGECDAAEVERVVRHILRMDEDFAEFYGIAGGQKGLEWVIAKKGGRLLRSPTVWEDLVKTICTTNCSWGLTRNMVTNLVEKLGEPNAAKARAFPTAEAMAGVDAGFYRDEIRAGYRSAYFAELATAVADGNLDPESWLETDLSTVELKKEMKRIKGVGDYAAENLLKLVGRYDGLALDSWLRSGFYGRHNDGNVCEDKVIEQHYDKFGKWRGLAIWCDMTESWFETEPVHTA